MVAKFLVLIFPFLLLLYSMSVGHLSTIRFWLPDRKGGGLAMKYIALRYHFHEKQLLLDEAWFIFHDKDVWASCH